MSDEPDVVGPTFVDTNILAYAFDQSEKKKRKICEKLVRDTFQGESNSYLSGQVLGELFVVLTKKVANPLSKEKASTIVSGFINSSRWKKINYDHTTVRRALIDAETINISFWDLLIAETMKDAGVNVLLTENIKDFDKVRWIKTINPIAT